MSANCLVIEQNFKILHVRKQVLGGGHSNNAHGHLDYTGPAITCKELTPSVTGDIYSWCWYINISFTLKLTIGHLNLKAARLDNRLLGQQDWNFCSSADSACLRSIPCSLMMYEWKLNNQHSWKRLINNFLSAQNDRIYINHNDAQHLGKFYNFFTVICVNNYF